MADAFRYAIGDLADLGGVSRRTVRYYVQEGLLPAPLGVGRGNHYGAEHLEQLLKVKALQEAGRTLDEIRRELTKRSRQSRAQARAGSRRTAAADALATADRRARCRAAHRGGRPAAVTRPAGGARSLVPPELSSRRQKKRTPMPDTTSIRSGLFTKDESPVPLTGVSIDAEISSVLRARRRDAALRQSGSDTRSKRSTCFRSTKVQRSAVSKPSSTARSSSARSTSAKRRSGCTTTRWSAGDGAFLLDEERPDVFQASVGNLPPGKEVLVKLTYVTELTVEGQRTAVLDPDDGVASLRAQRRSTGRRPQRFRGAESAGSSGGCRTG